MEEEIQYKISSDTVGNPLEGSKNYKLHLPPDIPASNFWSIIVYDNRTGLMIRTDQPWPSVHSQRTKLLVNRNGSIDTWFGPQATSGKENNWVKTIPGQGWNMILRLYYPMKAWFDNAWRPGDLEEMK